MYVYINGKIISGVPVCFKTQQYEITNLTPYIFRQKVQELLFLCNDSFMKLEIEEVLDKLKKYMNENNLEDDIFLKSLHDDLWLILNTEGTKLNKMFLTARSNSNGKQLSYNINKVPTNIGFHFNTLLLSREPVNKMNSTPKQLEIMRSCSQPINDEEY